MKSGHQAPREVHADERRRQRGTDDHAARRSTASRDLAKNPREQSVTRDRHRQLADDEDPAVEGAKAGDGGSQRYKSGGPIPGELPRRIGIWRRRGCQR